MSMVEELFGQFSSLKRVALVRDVVPFEYAPGTMARDLHDHRLSHPCPPKIPNGRPAEIMEEQAGHASGLTS